MAKKIRFKTTSLGSEPDQPDIQELTGFIRAMKGKEADLISYYLTRSLKLQVDAGITSPAGGGRYMQARFEEALGCSSEGCHVNTSVFEADAQVMTKTAGSVRSVLPSPGLLPGCPDLADEEASADFCEVYAKVLRSMRDKNIAGHILHAKEVSPIETEYLSSQKTFFVIPDGSLGVQAGLLEFQSTIALTCSRVQFLDDLVDQYDIRTLILVDSDEEGFKKALKHLDPDRIQVGGYGTGSEGHYWSRIAEDATTTIPSD
nr:hypothetical protein [uncultured Methanospirillum sp.]